MAHRRQAIREAVVDLLKDETAAEDRVFPNRVTRYWQSELPAINIYSGPEPVTPRDMSGRQKIRNLELKIEITVEANEGLDDELDAIAQDVEELIESNSSLSGTVLSTVQTNTEPELVSDGEKQVGKCTLSFEVKYIE